MLADLATSHALPPFSGRNRAILAREAWFQAQADAMVRRIVWLATGGHPAAMRLCLRHALPVGRGRAMPIRLPPLESPAKRDYALGQIAGALHYGLLSVREAAALLPAIEGDGVRIPDLSQLAKLEDGLAKAAAAFGADHMFTISDGPLSARAAAVAAARARGWIGEAGPEPGLEWDETPELRAGAKPDDGGQTTEDG